MKQPGSRAVHVSQELVDFICKHYANTTRDELIALCAESGIEALNNQIIKIQKMHGLRKSIETKKRQSSQANVFTRLKSGDIQKNVARDVADKPNTLINSCIKKEGRKTVHRMLGSYWD